jgi:hypothetical protein
MKVNKKFVSMLLFLCIIGFIGNVNAVTWGTNNAQDVNVGHNPTQYFETDDDEVYFTLVNHGGESLELFEAYDGTSNIMMLHEEGNIRGGIVASNGYLYYATEDGIFKRLASGTTPYWVNGEPLEAPQDDGNGNVTVAGSTYNAPNYDMSDNSEYDTNVKKVTTQTARNGILREEDGYIYYTTDGNDIYSIKLENDLTSFYTSVSNNLEVFDIYDGVIGGIHTDGDLRDITIDVYYNDNLIKNYNRHNDYADQRFNQRSFSGSYAIISPKKIYVGAMAWGLDDYNDHSGETKTLNINNILNSTGGYVDNWGYDDSYSNSALQKPDWVSAYKQPIFAQITNSGDNLVIAETQDAKANPTTKPVELEYDETSLSTELDQYYNNTAIDIYWSIEGRTTQGEMTTEEFEQSYRYQIDFINPSGFKFNEYRISATKLEAGRGVLSGLIEFSGYGTVRLEPPANNWNNGTYTIRLYEVNRTTSGKALLTQNSYEIVNESSEGGGTISEPPEDKTGADFFADIIGSQYFWAMFIIVIPAVALGSIHGVSGMFIGTGTGVILTYLAGFLPLWVMLVFVMMIAIGMSIIMRDTITSRY